MSKLVLRIDREYGYAIFKSLKELGECLQEQSAWASGYETEAEYYEENANEIKKRMADYRESNRKIINEKKKDYWSKNKSILNKQRREEYAKKKTR